MRGYWATSTPEQPEVPTHFTTANISYAVPGVQLTEAKVHYIKPAGANPAGCTGTAAEPAAESGNLCVYAGVETLENAEFHGIVRATNTGGAQKTGATLAWEEISSEALGKIRVQGTYAYKR